MYNAKTIRSTKPKKSVHGEVSGSGNREKAPVRRKEARGQGAKYKLGISM
jgi:hypothetical protein